MVNDKKTCMICSHKVFAITSLLSGLLLMIVILGLAILIYWHVSSIRYIGGPEGPAGERGPGSGGGFTSTFLTVSREMFL